MTTLIVETLWALLEHARNWMRVMILPLNQDAWWAWVGNAF